MAFTYGASEVKKRKYAIFMKYGHERSAGLNTNFVAHLKLLGKNFLNKSSRSSAAVDADDNVSINITNAQSSLFLFVHGINSGGTTVDFDNTDPFPANNRVFYIFASDGDIDIQIEGTPVGTIEENEIGCLIFNDNGTSGILYTNKFAADPAEPDDMFYPMGVVLADDMSFGTPAGDALKDIEGLEYTISANIECTFSIAQLFTDIITFEDTACVNNSGKTNVELVIYDKDDRIIAMKNMQLNKDIEVIGNDVNKTIYRVKKESSPTLEDLVFA